METNKKLKTLLVTRGIKNCRFSLFLKGCSPLQLLCNLIGNRPQSATFHTANVSCNKGRTITIKSLSLVDSLTTDNDKKNNHIKTIMTMKNTIIISTIAIALLLSSCGSVKQIGKVNMISNRNVDPNLKYKLISSYSGGSKRELKKTRAKTLEDAIDQTVRKVPGAEFLMNVKIYVVDSRYYAVEGDAWGSASDVSYRGFKVGDKVTWKNKKNIVDKIKGGQKNYLTGVITGLKDNKACLIKVDEGDTVEVEYDDLTKSN